jgi:hypothetical protein
MPTTPSGIEPATFWFVVQQVQALKEDNSLLVTGMKMAIIHVALERSFKKSLC